MSTVDNKSRIDAIVRACRIVSKMGSVRSGTPESHKIYYQMLSDYYNRILQAEQQGSYIAAHTIFFPVEILYAMDIVPMHTELTAWMSALFAGNCSDLLANAAEVGLAAEICSPYRVLAGALAIGAVPKPNVVLWTNLICDNAAKSGELVMHMADCDGYFVDCPFEKTDLENRYLKGELEGVIKFLEDKSGHKMDWGKLSDLIVNIDRQLELYREINELRQAVPSPFPPQDFLKLFTVDCLFAGRPEATAYLEAVRRELIDAIDRPQQDSPQQRFRIMNIFMPPVLHLGAIEKLSMDNGVVSVADPYFCHWADGRLDPQKPLDSVIKKIGLHPVMVMHGPLDDSFLQTAITCARQSKADGAILYAHVGCRQSAALIKLLKDGLNDEDIPVLIVDCDIIDITIAPQEEVRNKLEGFFELLEENS